MEELKEISLEQLVPEGLVSFVMGFVDHLNYLGFGVNGDTASDIFVRCGKTQIETAQDIEKIMRPIVVKSKRQDDAFHDVFVGYAKNRSHIVVDEKTAERLKQKISKLEELETEKDSIDSTIEKKQAEAEALENRIKTDRQLAPGTKALAREYDQMERGYQRILKHVKDENIRIKLLNYAKGEYVPLSEKETEDMTLVLYGLLADAMLDKEYVKLMRLITNNIHNLRDEAKCVSDDMAELNARMTELDTDCMRRDELQQNVDALTKQINKELTIIKKDEALSHRELFIDGENAVWCDAMGETCALNKKFFRLNREEKHFIYEYIKSNTRKFKTRLARCMQTHEKQQLDIRQTSRKARATFGVPLKLYYKKKTRKKPKVLLFLDISGSCVDAAELMLFFIHCMREVFPGGCGAYVFVNKLYDISEFLNEDDPELAVKQIFEAIPTKGAYSDYGVPFREFYENHMNEVTDNTFVFFMGDARNNMRESGEEYVKAICARARKSYWLCTEPRVRWNKLDSIIDVYARYTNRVGEVLTAGQLLEFLMNI